MKLLVCVKLAPEDASAAFDEQGAPLRDRAALGFSPADQSAAELALRVKDEVGAQITVLSMGPARTGTALQTLLARGADEAVLLSDPAFAGSDTLATARTLAAGISKLGAFDFILCGRRASDGETGQVGPALAALLGVPVCPNVLTATLRDGGVTGIRLTDDGEANFDAHAPALLTLCEWRYPLRLPGIAGLRRARGMTVRVYAPAMIGLDAASCGLAGSPTRVVRTTLMPFERKHPAMAESAEAMAVRICAAAEAAHA